MTDLEFDKLPSVVQWSLGIGGLIASIIAWVFGTRNRVSSAEDAAARELDEATKERDRLQAQVDDNELRKDVEQVVKATREALEHRIEGLDERLREVELEQARLGRRPR